MSFEKLSLVYFSPTGTTRRTVQNIAAGIALPLQEIDRTAVSSRKQPHHFSSKDLVVIALPVYGGRLPGISNEFFAGITADKTPAAIVAVYGNRHYDDALIELKNCAIAAGFMPIAAGAFLGEHSYTGKVAANRPDADDATAGNSFGARFLQKAQAHASATMDASGLVDVPGHFPYEKPVVNSGITPVANDNCIDCHTCVEGCPTEAIDRQNPRLTDKDKCISCCYCVKVCPNDARHMEDPRILATVNRLETLFMTRREPEIFI
ncbi:ferredoxin [Ereboglobus sp. PH5-10]|uniref:4Fe-4S binding protein n=1 Tax=Ereboglobus sp. PH5-10 TaxID=2940629 RepID=UPI0024065DF7|nr:4Fe-4S binding protein [Ereboglobus sp. PH5-10]MDF9826438.1 ferredoxin [Ereboglobus sp. PH5-10]